MAELWIDAARALRLIAKSSGESSAARIICARAHAGLVKSRARLLTREERRASNVDLPSTFWWAEGEEALEQDWTTGDFATWIDGTDQYRAFGVSFSLDGLLEMLPFEGRAAAARQMSVASDPAWVTARDAPQFAFAKAGFEFYDPETAIIARARLGFITARAVQVDRADDPQRTGRLGLVKQEREWDVPDWFWQNFTGQGFFQDWTHGSFEGQGVSPDGWCQLKLQGVHFLTASLEALLPAAPPTQADEPQKTPPGGRPALAWWDDMWCAVWGLIYHGDFKPATQADVERAMHTWASKNGHDAAVSTVRLKARKLFHAYSKEVENFLDP